MASTSHDLDAFDITLYHMKPTRSTRVVWLLHELKSMDKVRIERINLLKGGQYTPSFRGMNKMSAVPTMIVKSKEDSTEMTMTESSGICLWLADMVPSGGLKPAPENVFGVGQYYRMVTFAGCSMDELLWDIRCHEELLPEEERNDGIAKAARKKFLGKVVPALEDVLRDDSVEFVCEPFHEGFTTADVMVGFGLLWANVYGLLKDSVVLLEYLDRVKNRSGFREAFERRAGL